MQITAQHCVIAWLTVFLDTKDKPYKCYCGAAFARRDLLTRHERLDHDHNSSYQRVQAPANLQASKSNTTAQSHTNAQNVIDISTSNWTIHSTTTETGSQWLPQGHSSDANHQSLSNDTLTLSQDEGPAHLVCTETATQQFGPVLQQNNEDAFLSPGTYLFTAKFH
jgi:hypothetical protein